MRIGLVGHRAQAALPVCLQMTREVCDEVGVSVQSKAEHRMQTLQELCDQAFAYYIHLGLPLLKMIMCIACQCNKSTSMRIQLP